MRFTIRDVLWLMVVAGLTFTVIVQFRVVAKSRERGALNERRIKAATWFMNEYGYLVMWADDDWIHGAFNTYPHPERVGPPAHNEQNEP